MRFSLHWVGSALVSIQVVLTLLVWTNEPSISRANDSEMTADEVAVPGINVLYEPEDGFRVWVDWQDKLIVPGSLCSVVFTWETSLKIPVLSCEPVVSLELTDLQGKTVIEIKDHAPQPVQSWKPDQVVKYSRNFWIPDQISPGLYQSSLALIPCNQDKPVMIGQHNQYFERLQTGVIAISKPLPLHGNLFKKPDFKYGAYPLETDPDTGLTFQWIGPVASASIRNPYQDLVVFIEISRPLPFGSNQVTLNINGQEFGKVEVTDIPTRRFIKLPMAFFENRDLVKFEFISTDPIVPQEKGISGDHRLLSFKLQHFYIIDPIVLK